MIEAGLMTSLLENTAPAREIGLCHIGGLDFDNVRQWFDLQNNHIYLYSLVGGRIDPSQAKLAALIQESAEIQTALQLVAREPEPNGNGAAASLDNFAHSGEDERAPEELREFLAKKLPHYMVPSAFVILDELPLSANGKVDRTLLPKPEASVEMVSQEYVAPSTDNEQMVAAIWRDVLGVEKVGLYDNFFDIGGNSLKLIRVHIKLREALNTDLSIAQMFEHPTVSSLASVLSSTDAAGTALDDVDDRASRQHEAFSRARRLTGIRREDGDRDMAEDHN
jgi:hypothetical protein